jgi:hypothetical protein
VQPNLTTAQQQHSVSRLVGCKDDVSTGIADCLAALRNLAPHTDIFNNARLAPPHNSSTMQYQLFAVL